MYVVIKTLKGAHIHFAQMKIGLAEENVYVEAVKVVPRIGSEAPHCDTASLPDAGSQVLAEQRESTRSSTA